MKEQFINKINSLNALGGSRIKFIEYIFNYFISLNRPINILETGCGHTDGIPQFKTMTCLFAEIIKNFTGGKLTTIDIDENNMNKCKKNSLEYKDFIDYRLGDSLKIIDSLDKNIINDFDLVFLDSFDFDLRDPHPSAIHHFTELMLLYPYLNENCIVAIDDNYLPNTWISWTFSDGKTERFETKDNILGKGMYCDGFLKNFGWTKYDKNLFFENQNVFMYKLKSHF